MFLLVICMHGHPQLNARAYYARHHRTTHLALKSFLQSQHGCVDRVLEFHVLTITLGEQIGRTRWIATSRRSKIKQCKRNSGSHIRASVVNLFQKCFGVYEIFPDWGGFPVEKWPGWVNLRVQTPIRSTWQIAQQQTTASPQICVSNLIQMCTIVVVPRN